MARAPKTETTQAEPTAPRATNATGRAIDEHGLPLSGPARIAALDGKPDPRDIAAEAAVAEAATDAAPLDPATAPAAQD